MKKLALTIAIVLGISLFTYAQTEQKTGGLFQYGEVTEEESENNEIGTTATAATVVGFVVDQGLGMTEEGLFGQMRNGLPGLPGHDNDTNQSAPLGSGALLFIGFGAAYALKKKNQK